MLDRILEPEVMDSVEEALAYDAMDHSAVNKAFVDDLLASLEGRQHLLTQETLDLGAGTAQIPVELCRRHPDFRVVAIDLSVAMLDMARNNVEVAGLTSQILLAHVDAKALPFADGRFSCVISNSIVHHIADPAPVLAEAWRVLAPGGHLFVRDLVRPPDLDTWQHLVKEYAGDATEHQRQLFADSLRAALSLEEVRTLAGQLAIPAVCRQSSDRHWTLIASKSA